MTYYGIWIPEENRESGGYWMTDQSLVVFGTPSKGHAEAQLKLFSNQCSDAEVKPFES